MAGTGCRWVLIFVFCLFVVSPKSGMAVNVRIGVPVPEKTKEYKLLQERAERIRLESDGGITIELSFMKDERSRFGEMVAAQELDGCLALETDFTALNLGPQSLAYSLPFLFTSRQQAVSVRAKLDTILLENMGGEMVEALGFVDFGFMYLASSKKLSTREDWTKQVFWLPEAESIVIRGLKSTELQFRQFEVKRVLNDLKSGRVDGVLGPLPLMIMKRWHTALKTVYASPVAYSYGIWTVDKQFFSKLTGEKQHDLAAALNSLGAELERAFSQRTNNAQKVLQRYGIEFVEPDHEVVKQQRAWLQQWIPQAQRELKLSEDILQILTASVKDGE